MTVMKIVSPSGELSQRSLDRIKMIKQVCEEQGIAVEHERIEPRINGIKGSMVFLDEVGSLPPALSGVRRPNTMSFFGCNK